MLKKIRITFYFRYWNKGKYHVYPKVSRKNIEEIKKFVCELLPVENFKVIGQNGKEYKRGKFCRISGISIELSKLLDVNHKEEYEFIFKPIDRVLFRRGAAIYNMWGYNDTIPWQMDGRHMHSDKREELSEDAKELKKKLLRLEKGYREISMNLSEIARKFRF